MKFKKIVSSDKVIVLLPDDFYKKAVRKIRGDISGCFQTRSFVYFLSRDGQLYRHPVGLELYDSSARSKVELCVSQIEFCPEDFLK